MISRLGIAAVFFSVILSAHADETVIRIKGSDTINAKLMPQLTAAYREAGNNEVQFEIEKEGSDSAFTSLEEGSADVGASSRLISSGERKKLAENGVELVERVAFYDMLAVIVNDENPVETLTENQVEKIYTGEITNWSELGGNDEPIKALSRDDSFGVSAVFQMLAMSKKPYGDTVERLEVEKLPADEVAAAAGSIGYSAKAFLSEEGVRPISIDGVPFDTQMVKAYPLTRALYYYTPKDVSPEIEDFLDWITTSAEAGEIIDEVGFVPVPAAKKPQETPTPPEEPVKAETDEGAADASGDDASDSEPSADSADSAPAPPAETEPN